MVKLSLASALVLVVGVLAACGGGDGGAGGPAGGGTPPFHNPISGPAGGGTPPFSLMSGNGAAAWTGTWASANGIDAGEVEAIFTRAGGSIGGSITFTGSRCFEDGQITGDVEGANVAAAVRADGIEIRFSIAVSGGGNDSMAGSYDVVSGGACTGDTGTITLTRTSPREVNRKSIGDERGVRKR